jgi:hypothetical protein
MPFVNHSKNGPLRITHLMDQWKEANREYQQATEGKNGLDTEAQAALARLRRIERELRGGR